MYSMDSQREWWKGDTNLKQKKSVEDYLKTIYILSGKKDVHGADTFCRLLTGLGVDEKAAASDACEMEHAVSAESYQALRMLVAEGNGGT